jgi:hypothetical protein
MAAMAEDQRNQINIDDIQAFPVLTEAVPATPRSTTPGTPGAAPLGQIVESALREVLAWRPKASDPRGFVAALNQAFSLTEVEGHTIWTWTPHSYAVQADMGAVTGAQASIYARAKAALDQSLPLLEGLYSLRADADPQDVEAIRAIVRSGLIELVSELGMVGGPRLQRVNAIFDSLLGAHLQGSDPEQVRGLLSILRERFGMERQQVNTIDEEQNLTNFLILADHVIALQRSWRTLRHYFDREGTDVFLGTQLVLLARALAVVAESVQETYFTMDSVFLEAAERQTILLDLGPPEQRREHRLTIAELLGWVEYFASEEAPRIIREAGKDGVISFRPTLETLSQLVHRAVALSQQNASNPTPGFHTKRVQRSLEELAFNVDEALNLTRQLERQRLVVELVDPDSAPPSKLRLTINGEGFQRGAQVRLKQVGSPMQPISGLGPPTFVSSTEMKATFDLHTAAVGSQWTVILDNPDGGQSSKERALTIVGLLRLPPPRVDSVSPPQKPNTDPAATLTIEGQNFSTEAEVRLSLKEKGFSIEGTGVNVAGNVTITAKFNLTDVPKGDWDVVVRNPDGSKSDPPGYFTVSLPPVVSEVEPHQSPGPVSSPIPLTISGENFQTNAKVKLTRGNENPIQGEKVYIDPNGTKITATFTFSPRATGTWDVVVDNLDGGSGSKAGGFTISKQT